MSTSAVVDVRTLTPEFLPDVCAVSGVRTGDLVRFRVLDEPVSDWQRRTALSTLSAYALVPTVVSLTDWERDPIDVWLPVCKPVQVRHRRTLTGSASLLGVGIGIGLGSATGILAGPGWNVALSVLSVLGGLGVLLQPYVTWPRVRVNRDDMSATIMGVNPVFARAVARQGLGS